MSYLKLVVVLKNPIQFVDSETVNGSKTYTTILDSSHSRLLNSFRKLSSRDESSLYSSSSSSEKVIHSGGMSGGMGSLGPKVPPPLMHPKMNPRKLGKLHRKKRSAWKESVEEVYERAALYIYYDGSMRLLLILDPEYESDSSLISSLVSIHSFTTQFMAFIQDFHTLVTT